MCEPRSVAPTDDRPPLLIFTDGSEEDGPPAIIACGAIMFDPLDNSREFFSAKVPEQLLREWKQQGNAKSLSK